MTTLLEQTIRALCKDAGIIVRPPNGHDWLWTFSTLDGKPLCICSQRWLQGQDLKTFVAEQARKIKTAV